MVMALVYIDDDFLAEIDSGAESALNWTRESITAWGLQIAGEEMPASGARSGPVFLGQDGGHESRHVGRWVAY